MGQPRGVVISCTKLKQTLEIASLGQEPRLAKTGFGDSFVRHEPSSERLDLEIASLGNPHFADSQRQDWDNKKEDIKSTLKRLIGYGKTL